MKTSLNKFQKIQLLIFTTLFFVQILFAMNQTKKIDESKTERAARNFFFAIATNFVLPRALYVAADLKIADILAQQPCTLLELSQKTNSHEESLHRLMHLLQLHELFYCDHEHKYHNTHLSEFMRSDIKDSMRPLLLHEDETRWNSLGNLGLSIKTGKPAFDQLYKMPYFSYTTENELLNARFKEAMTTISNIEEKNICTCYPFNNFPVIADLGGGRGGMLKRVLSKHTTVHGIIADLPEVIKDHKLLEKFQTRFSIEPLDFFKPITLKADLFILKRILHDWDNEKALQILKNVAQTMSSTSRLLIIESLITDDDNDEQAKMIAHIDLLLLAIFGGCERTYEDYNRLINEADLTIVGVFKTDSLVSIIECSLKN